jgi:hypothetical protein
MRTHAMQEFDTRDPKEYKAHPWLLEPESKMLTLGSLRIVCRGQKNKEVQRKGICIEMNKSNMPIVWGEGHNSLSRIECNVCLFRHKPWLDQIPIRGGAMMVRGGVASSG